jgi:Ca2+-transporting ATPase
MVEIVPRLQVLAQSPPEDKKVLVEMLKGIGEIEVRELMTVPL